MACDIVAVGQNGDARRAHVAAAALRPMVDHNSGDGRPLPGRIEREERVRITASEFTYGGGVEVHFVTFMLQPSGVDEGASRHREGIEASWLLVTRAKPCGFPLRV